MTSSWFFLSTLNYDARSATHQIHMVYISSNNDRHPVPRTFTPLHYTCRHFASSHLNFTQKHFTKLHYPLIWLNPIYISYRSTSPHITTLVRLSSTNESWESNTSSRDKQKKLPIPLTCVAHVDSHVGTGKLLMFLQVTSAPFS